MRAVSRMWQYLSTYDVTAYYKGMKPNDVMISLDKREILLISSGLCVVDPNANFPPNPGPSLRKLV